MKIFFSIVWSLFLINNIIAQTGIGTTTPNASAKLDVSSSNKGFLPPRISLTDIYDQTTIPSPATGLLVYCKGDAGLAAGYYYWNGNAWATIATAGGSGSFASSFMRGSRTGTQTIAVGGVVTFSNIDNSAGNDISLNTSTGKITLAPGNTYRIRGAVPNLSGGQRPAFIWYNENTSLNIGSGTYYYNPGDGAALPASGGMAEVIITPNVSTVISFRLLSSLSSGSVTVGGSADFSATGSYPWFDIEVISGNTPITGQSVDYVSVSRTGSDQTVNTGSTIIFNTINGGNIPYNTSTGAFSLTAGKTYKLIAGVSISNGNTAAKEVNFYWKNAAGDILGSKGEMLSPNANVEASGNGIAYAIYTPTINTTVSAIVSYSTASTILWQNYTFASIEQIGSSAFVNPWVLSGNDVYNTTGDIGIGTSSPSESAILDLTSSSKGLLPPRVTLTAKSGTSSPIASPTTGLIAYNTASAGTGGDAVTPGYYYYNGTIWTRMDPEGWSTGVPITFGAVTTAPTKGTIVIDYVKYRNIGGKEYEVEYNFLQSTAGTAGTGDYLFTLPSSLQFDFTVPGQTAYTGVAGYNGMKNRIASSMGDLLVSNFHSSSIAIPYDATRFRIMNNNWGNNTWLMHNPSNYAISDGSYGMKMTFRFKAL